MLRKFGDNHAEIKSKLYSRCRDEHCKVWSTYMEQGFNSDKNVRQAVATDERLVTLTNLVVENFPEDFLTKGSFTVFAPVDAAFGMINKKDLNALLMNKKQLKKVLANHVVSGLVLDAQQISFLTEGDQIATLASDISNKLSFVTEAGNVYVSNGNTSAKVVDTLYATNGIVHLINRVLL